MISIKKTIIRDIAGLPKEVLMPWNEYLKIIEVLGLDLDEDAVSDLQIARQDRKSGNKDVYVDLDSI